MKRIVCAAVVAAITAFSSGCGSDSKKNDPKPADPGKAPEVKQLQAGDGTQPKGPGGSPAPAPKAQGAVNVP